MVILDPHQIDFTASVNMERAYGILSASTANVPPLDAAEYERFQDFWKAQFANKESIAIHNKHKDFPVQDVASRIIDFALH